MISRSTDVSRNPTFHVRIRHMKKLATALVLFGAATFATPAFACPHEKEAPADSDAPKTADKNKEKKAPKKQEGDKKKDPEKKDGNEKA
jgi:hypothetical protein